MAIVYTFPSQAQLSGAAEINRAHRIFAQYDVGFKLERLISAVNLLQTSVSALQAGAGSAAASGIGWSSFSATPTSTFAAITNFPD